MNNQAAHLRPGAIAMWRPRHSDPERVTIAGKVSWVPNDCTYATVQSSGDRVLCADTELHPVDTGVSP